MNDFNVNLVGLSVVCKQKAYVFPDDATPKQRTFVVTHDKGYNVERYSRKVRGRWLVDDFPDTIDTYGIESVKTSDGSVIRRPEEKTYVEVDIVAEPVLIQQKPRGRTAWSEDTAAKPAVIVQPSLSEVTPERIVNEMITNIAVNVAADKARRELVGHIFDLPTPTTPVNGSLVPYHGQSDVQLAKPKAAGAFDAAEAVRMYQAGTKMKEIVDALKGERAAGHTGNLVRKALRDAGVYKEPTK